MRTEKHTKGKAGVVKIVAYESKFKKAFKTLNVEWIDTYFKLEEEDKKLLEDPQKNILDKGGAIIIALLKRR